MTFLTKFKVIRDVIDLNDLKVIFFCRPFQTAMIDLKLFVNDKFETAVINLVVAKQHTEDVVDTKHLHE